MCLRPYSEQLTKVSLYETGFNVPLVLCYDVFRPPYPVVVWTFSVNGYNLVDVTLVSREHVGDTNQKRNTSNVGSPFVLRPSSLDFQFFDGKKPYIRGRGEEMSITSVLGDFLYRQEQRPHNTTTTPLQLHDSTETPSRLPVGNSLKRSTGLSVSRTPNVR